LFFALNDGIIKEKKKRGLTLSRRPPLLVVTNVCIKYSMIDCWHTLQNRENNGRLAGLNPITGGHFALS